MTKEKLPLVGFFPLFYNLAETGRALLVAKRYTELGGGAIFFSHGGDYEYLVQNEGFSIEKVHPQYNENDINRIVKINRGEQKGVPYDKKFLSEAVKHEIQAYRKTMVKMVVSFVNIPCSLSARVAHIPLVCITPAPGSFFLKIPDNFEHDLTRLIPQKIKVPIMNFYFNRSKKFLRPFNKVAKQYHLRPFSRTLDIMWGDVNLATNFLEFLTIFPHQQFFPSENYIGIISLEEIFDQRFTEEENKDIERKISNHLKNSKKSIFLTMGSSGDKEFFLRLLDILNTLNYQVIVVNTNILKKNEVPKFHEHILFLNVVPSIQKIHEMVDLNIIHGGQGTVYMAAYAGKPILGFPMQFEQHLNLEKIVGHGTGLMLSRKFFRDSHFISSIEYIFNHYRRFYRNAQHLTKILPKPEGDKHAAMRIAEILRSS